MSTCATVADPIVVFMDASGGMQAGTRFKYPPKWQEEWILRLGKKVCTSTALDMHAMNCQTLMIQYPDGILSQTEYITKDIADDSRRQRVVKVSQTTVKHAETLH